MAASRPKRAGKSARASRRGEPSGVVAIIGRPNVGKSTLFNRLVGKRIALTDDRPGVTRDRREGVAYLGGLIFTVIDTAGLEEADAESLVGRMRAQSEAAIDAADVSLFLVDAKSGMTAADKHFAELLRRSGKPVILAVNKSEGREARSGIYDAFSLGLGEPIPISAEHGEGMGELADELARLLPEPEEIPEPEPEPELSEDDLSVDIESDGFIEERPDRPMQVAIVGRPNAGKSTLINAIIGDERLLTGPEAGITRDAIAIDWQWRGRKFRLFDTAGLRRKAKIEEKLEKLSVADAINAIKFAEVVVLVIDATHPFEKQDLQIAQLIEREGRAFVIALDKWDLIEDRGPMLKDLKLAAEKLLPQVRGAPVVPVSGLSGEGLDKLMKAIGDAHKVWNKRVSTAAINRWLIPAIEAHPPPAVSGRRIKLRYMTQSKARPPTFIAFCSRPEDLPEAYRRYLVNGLRDTFGLGGTPVRLLLRKGENPFAGKKSN